MANNCVQLNLSADLQDEGDKASQDELAERKYAEAVERARNMNRKRIERRALMRERARHAREGKRRLVAVSPAPQYDVLRDVLPVKPSLSATILNLSSNNATQIIRDGVDRSVNSVRFQPDSVSPRITMTATLKPHILAEAIGLQRKCMSPEKLCGLFLAYRSFCDAFRKTFLQNCKVRHSTYGVNFDPGNVIIQTKSGIVYQFNKNVHIPILLQIAGRFIPQFDHNSPAGSWFEPFFEGLDQNQCLEFLDLEGDKKFLKRYLKSHKDHLPKIELGNFSMLDKLGSPQIDTLVLETESEDSNLTPCRIAAIEISKSIWTDRNPLNVRGAKLAFDKTFLKSLVAYGEFSYNVVLRMIKSMFPLVEEMAFCRVQVPAPAKKSPMGPLERLNSYIDQLWTAMLAHRGTVRVRAFYEGDMDELTTDNVIEACRSELVGYTVTEDHPFVRCTILKDAGGAKQLAVFAMFSSRGY